MFNFLNSTFLLASAAALVPLIIHLFSRRKVKVIEFSSVKHLKAMQKRQVRRLKIRQLLLLLLRMLIIFTVVLAFARPTTEGGNIGSHASVSAVIVFDNSASMEYYVTDGNLFDLAKKRTEKLISSFSESDEVVLLPVVSSSENKSTRFATAVTVQEQLSRLRMEYQTADFKTVLSSATEYLNNAANLNKELYLVTDRQRKSMPDTSLLNGLDANVYILSLPFEEIDNCGITSIDFAGQLILPGHDFNLTAHLKNYSSSDKENIIASLFIDGNRVAQTDVKIKSGLEERVLFTRSVSSTGFHSGYVELSDDKFIPDNRFYFSFRIPERSNLLIIDGDNTGQLISLALTPSASINQYWSVKTATPQNLAGVNFWEYDVIVITGAPVLPDTYLQRLKAFINRGRTVFLTYGPQTNIEYFNSNYSEISGVFYEKPIDENFTRAGYYTFRSFEMNHPVFTVFDFDRSEPPLIKFWTVPQMKTSEDAKTLLRFTGDRPALVEHSYLKGKVITFTGPISPGYSDITSQAFFVPFISRIVEYAASDLAEYDFQLYCGNNLIRTLSYEGSIDRYFTVLKPDSTSLAISPEDSEGGLLLKIKPADLPGIYSVSLSGREIDRFALNLDPLESDLSRIDSDLMAEALGLESFNTIEDNVEISEMLAQFRFGKELWKIFLWLAVFLVILELVLARSFPGEVD